MGDERKFGWQEVEPWPEPVDGADLLDAIARELGRFVFLPKFTPEMLALWNLHTYAFLLRKITTYIGIESPEKQCGKTTLLTVLSHFVHQPEIAANISPPAFFRVIEETRPTLLIDEGDTFLKRNPELRGILNAGYTLETAYVVRVANQEKDPGASRLVRFSCFCPKAIASIGHLPETLADRCIPIRMQRKTASENCERTRNIDATELRRKCARFVLDHEDAIRNARPVAPGGVADRTVDIWEPLLVLADLAGGRWPEIARQAMVALTASAQESNPIGSLFLDMYILFIESNADRMFSRTLATALDRVTDRPWAELLRPRGTAARQGKPAEVTELWLAKQLRQYGVRPKTIWIGEVSAKGYLLEDLISVFKRYIPRSEIEALKAEQARLQPPPPPPPENPKKDETGETPGGEAAAA